MINILVENLMNRTTFSRTISEVFGKGLNIIDAKNDDYANSGDPFQNFRICKLINVPIARGIMVRLMDKIVRISNLLDKEPSVKDEAIEDTIIDAINYLAILYAWLQEEKENASL